MLRTYISQHVATETVYVTVDILFNKRIPGVVENSFMRSCWHSLN